ncbi:MAG TPA: DUF2255 family protein [Candidatus Dormibacteraeota bacterium]|nr:DUF2255 family protein [Candidatus Dormibacteraeota bacterium]
MLDQLEEIEVETTSSDGVVHRTIVWPVVRDGIVYLRSYKGPAGRWYREAVADPSVALIVDGRRLPATAVSATDPASVVACSSALQAKYRGDASLRAMLASSTLPTTLRLVPA